MEEPTAEKWGDWRAGSRVAHWAGKSAVWKVDRKVWQRAASWADLSAEPWAGLRAAD